MSAGQTGHLDDSSLEGRNAKTWELSDCLPQVLLLHPPKLLQGMKQRMKSDVDEILQNFMGSS